MKKIIALILCFSAFTTYAAGISLNEILTNPAEYDNQIVEVEAEVIGDLIKDRGGVWINISSKETNIGIFSQRRDLDEIINYWGSYRQDGDIVRIRGTFYSKCPVHEERDIHSDDIEVLKEGAIRKEVIAPYKIRLAIVFFIICLTTAAVYFIKLGCRKKT
ncbi:MAG: hypothetical protein JSV34_06385 [Candidatus Omnitrophota bacterium]|nr:MAG: hypothetical protein JSV34_06385 [Candidatus Omnitrophota bacterium]